jgi:hypothetical protein
VDLHYALAEDGRIGWFYGTNRWSEGEFFRFQLTALELTASTP